ncbi:sodium-dependent dopamine transporter-like [Agrilus planipennis]|uniref:Sodium-dependent nutrient amino acid transporter 1 n=1 Tax=Agrilus planipennis TaxID=224129 RepID=A0A7F5RNK9_AGRPL|nr:sodium-dependent dopamine transporter-like [Agrilus planipennis]
MKIKKFSRRVSQVFSENELDSHIKAVSSEEKINYLRWAEFMAILLLIEISCNDSTTLYIELNPGTECFIILYFIFSVFFGIPTYLIQVFLGFYSRKGYFTYGYIMPVAKGVAWTLILNDTLRRMFDVAFIAVGFTYISRIFQTELPWKDCKFYEGDLPCYAMSFKGFDRTCAGYNEHHSNVSSLHYFYYSPFLYFKYVILKDQGIVYEWIYAAIIVYIIILILLLLRIEVIQKFLFFMFGLLFVMANVPIYFALRNNSSLLSKPVVFPMGLKNCFTSHHVVHLVGIAVLKEFRGTYLVLGTLAPPSFIPERDIMITYILRTIMLFCDIIILMTGLNSLEQNYELTDLRCAAFEPSAVMYAIIPDLISRWDGERVWLLIWFISNTLFSTLASSVTFSCIVISITRNFKIFKKLYNEVSVITCVICFSMNILFLQSNFMSWSFAWEHTGHLIVMCNIAFLICLVLQGYSLSKLQDDIHFCFKERASSFWCHGLKLTSIFTSMFLVIYYAKGKEPYVSHLELHYFYIIAGLLLLPTVGIALLILLKYYCQGKLHTCFKTTKSWGPPIKKLRFARAKFESSKDTLSKLRGGCGHNCLLRSSKLKATVYSLDVSRREFITKNKLEHLEIESDMMFL